MSNGVRNLRAMFENSNAAASPEPRGRSPVDHSGPGDSDDRPRSKVRASFVPVEPPPTSAYTPTDLGQTKGTPSNSTMAHRRESFSISEDRPDELADLKKIVTEEKEERSKSVAIPEAVPEQAVASRESSLSAPLDRKQEEKEENTDMPKADSSLKSSDLAGGGDEAANASASAPESGEPKVESTPGEPEENAVEDAEPVPVSSPEQTAAQPAENLDNPATGPTDEAAVEHAAPAQDEAAVEENVPAAEESAVEKASVEEETAIAEAAIAEEKVAAAEEAAIAQEESTSAPEADAQPAENPDKVVTGVQEDVSLRPAAPTDAPTITEDAAPAPEEAPATSSGSVAATPKVADSKPKTNGTPAAKKLEVKKPSTISTAKPSKALPASAKSPLPKAAPKTPPKTKATTPAPKPSPAPKVAKPAAPKEPVKAPATKAPAAKAPAAKVPTTKTSRSSLRPAVSSAAAPTASAVSKAKPAAPSTETKKPAASKPAPPALRKRYVQQKFTLSADLTML
jgi:hypothetical protein